MFRAGQCEISWSTQNITVHGVYVMDCTLKLEEKFFMEGWWMTLMQLEGSLSNC